jgi:hypothetical protein
LEHKQVCSAGEAAESVSGSWLPVRHWIVGRIFF